MVKINRNVGARVIVKSVLVEINPKVKIRKLKNVQGTIVERGDHEQYYHTCSGGYTYVWKNLIKKDVYNNYAIKLDNGVVDIENNNIIVVREIELKFLDRLPVAVKFITKKQYDNALKLIKLYEKQHGII